MASRTGVSAPIREADASALFTKHGMMPSSGQWALAKGLARWVFVKLWESALTCLEAGCTRLAGLGRERV